MLEFPKTFARHRGSPQNRPCTNERGKVKWAGNATVSLLPSATLQGEASVALVVACVGIIAMAQGILVK